MAKAVLKHAVAKAVDTLRRHFRANVVPQLTAHRGMHFFVVGKSERQALDLRHRDHLAKDPAHERHELELARDQHLERGRIRAWNAAVLRMHGDLHRAIGALRHLIP